jgi:hypothetical protein
MGAKLESRNTVLIALGAAALGCMVLSVIVEMNEISLPHEIQMNELRLLDIETYANLKVNPEVFTLNSAEQALAELVQCRNKPIVDDAQNCMSFVKAALHRAPIDGALWVEYARELAATGASGDEIGKALVRSHETSHHEAWVISKRMSLALSVWPVLNVDAKTILAAEAISNLKNNTFMLFLADTYVQRPMSRSTLTELMTKATAQQQNRFLQLVKNRTL